MSQSNLPIQPGAAEGLSDPARRYFASVLPTLPNQPHVRTARFEQTGTFAVRTGKWIPFEATEVFHTDPPSFVWVAKMGHFIKVRDSYCDGVGSMQAKFLGLFPIVDQHGTPEIAAAALLRYLAESAWFPTALLPSHSVRWDGNRVELTDHGITVSADIEFDPEGQIHKVKAMRHRDVNGAAVLTPWQGIVTDYQEIAGMRIPMSGEVSWILPDVGEFPYWRARTRKAEFEFNSANQKAES